MQNHSFKLLLLLLLGSQWALGQSTAYRGTVLDALSGEPLAFATIVRASDQQGTITDLDGRFRITAEEGDKLLISFVGYESKTIAAGTETDLQVRLSPAVALLTEVVVRPEENPAWRIIRQAIAQRDENDPRRYEGYSYQAYHKTVLQIDTVVDNRPPPRKPPRNPPKPEDVRRDSIREAVFQNDMHMWVTESVTENFFRRPGQSKEYLVATKSSLPNDFTGGFNPIDFQPFGFYREFIRLEFAGRDYINPVSRGTFDRYDFSPRDTIYQGQDTTFVIQFEPLARTNFAGLKGLLYIHTDGYAIENVIAEAADTTQTVYFRIQQQSARVNGEWFPKQLRTDLSIRMAAGKVYMDYSFLNRSDLDAVDLRTPPPGIFNHYYRENTAVSDAPESYWDSIRTVPLDRRERNTYVWWDSLPELQQPYRFLKGYNGLVKTVATGLWEVGPLDIVLKDLIQYNEYENWRLGLGLQTGPSLTRWGHLYAYAGYGFRDRAWKYGGAAEWKIYPHRDVRLRLSYEHDLVEPGSRYYLSAANNPWSGLNARTAASRRMDTREQWRLDAFYRPNADWQLNPYLLTEDRRWSYPYQFVNEEDVTQVGRRQAAGLRLRWAPREQLVKMGRLEALLRPVLPVVDIQAERAKLPELGFWYTELSLRGSHELKWKALGTTYINLQAGWLSEAIPYSFLFNAPGARSEDNDGIFTQNTFQTMGLYEFASDRYAYLFFEHSFERLLGQPKTPYSRPELNIIQNIGWGSLQEAERHQDLTFQQLDAVYLESGLRVDNLLRIPYFQVVYIGLGGGVSYRWGAYHLPEWKDNLRWQLSLNLTI